MKQENKYNIYIGLLTADMKTQLNKEQLIKAVVREFKNIGIIGLNITQIKGYWDGKPENALKFSFINTFNIKEEDLYKSISYLKGYLLQESILIEKEEVQYAFI